MSRPDLLSATNHLFAVVDHPEAVSQIRHGLADAGVAISDVRVLEGDDGAAAIDASGRGGGPVKRLMRILAFTATDQSVDFAAYEAALRQGRAVIVVRAPGDRARERAVDVVRGAGAHFVNYYGRMVTEEIVPWRGDPPPIGWQYRR